MSQFIFNYSVQYAINRQANQCLAIGLSIEKASGYCQSPKYLPVIALLIAPGLRRITTLLQPA